MQPLLSDPSRTLIFGFSFFEKNSYLLCCFSLSFPLPLFCISLARWWSTTNLWSFEVVRFCFGSLSAIFMLSTQTKDSFGRLQNCAELCRTVFQKTFLFVNFTDILIQNVNQYVWLAENNGVRFCSFSSFIELTWSCSKFAYFPMLLDAKPMQVNASQCDPMWARIIWIIADNWPAISDFLSSLSLNRPFFWMSLYG